VNIAIDSQILIYAGVVPEKKGTQRCADFDDLQLRAKLLLEQANSKDGTIILPWIAIGELLIPVQESQRGAVIGVLQKMFFCASFDLPAASIAADLAAQYRKLPSADQYKERSVLRADTMIIASAKAAGATDFYTHDRKCRTLAGLVMLAHDLPLVDKSMEDIWIASDIKDGKEPPPAVAKGKSKKKKKGDGPSP